MVAVKAGPQAPSDHHVHSTLLLSVGWHCDSLATLFANFSAGTFSVSDGGGLGRKGVMSTPSG